MNKAFHKAMHIKSLFALKNRDLVEIICGSQKGTA